MPSLEKSRLLDRTIADALSSERLLQSGVPFKHFFIVLDDRSVLELLPYGLRLADSLPPDVRPERTEEVTRALGRRITRVITDSRSYPAAADDATLQQPPYDDVYLILDDTLWMANRLFENGENSLTVETIDELYNLSDHYFDYWTRDEIALEGGSP